MIYKLSVHSFEDIEEVRVLQWHKAEGDAVEPEQLLVELETSKAIVELRSKTACVLRTIVAKPGDWAKCGSDPIAWLSDTKDEPLATSDVDLTVAFEVV